MKKTRNSCAAKWALFLTLAIFASSCASKGAGMFDAKEFAGNKKEIANRYIEVEKGKTLKGAKKVVIPSFKVVFKTQSAQSDPDGRATLVYALKGIEKDSLAPIAEKLYEKFVADLNGIGIEVVSQSELEKNANYRTLVEQFGEKSPDKENGIMCNGQYVVTAFGMPVYGGASPDSRGTLAKISMVGIDLAASAIKAATGLHAENYEANIMRDFNASLVKATMVVDFADFTENAAKSPSGIQTATNHGLVSDTKVNGAVLLNIKPSSAVNASEIATEVDFFAEAESQTIGGANTYKVNESAYTRISLKNPVISGEKIAKEVGIGSKSAGQVTTELASGALAVVGFLTGTKAAATNFTNYDVHVDETVFRATAENTLLATGEMISLKIKESL